MMDYDFDSLPKPKALRSSHWPAVERAHIAQFPKCACCGTEKDRQVHHVKPFHNHPHLELDPNNLITLCRVHHFWWGHLGSWFSWNKSIVRDAAAFLRKVIHRPKSEAAAA
jgi:hypothetical protein